MSSTLRLLPWVISSHGKGKLSAWNPSSYDSFRSTHCICSFENTSAPFNIEEYDVEYKSQNYLPWNFDQYRDFNVRRGSSPPDALPDITESLTVELI